MVLKKEAGWVLGIGAAAAVIFGPLWWRPAVPCIAGDLSARAQAQIPDTFKNVYLDATRMQFGLGSAAIGGWNSLGDALAIGGRAWLRTTHAGSPNYFATVSNRYFQSNGFLYIPADRESNLTWRLDRPLSLPELWDALAGQYPEGVMFGGYLRLSPLALIAMARPAIEGFPLRQHAPRYFTRPLESTPQAWAYVAGVAMARAAGERRDRAWMSSLLNTRGNARSGTGLVHALWLNAAPVDRQAPPVREQVNAVGRLVAEESRVVEGELRLYPLTRAGACPGVAEAR